MKRTQQLAILPIVALAASSALALEYPIGEPKNVNGMEVAAVYLQPVTMEPMGQMPAGKADIHLEADIHALEGNKNGFEPGSWVPYLTVEYELTKEGGKTKSGTFDAMVANDGPHYGSNVKLDGAGKYHLVYTIKHPGMMRHTDKETGVAEWFDDFKVEYDFAFAGIGKKGGY